MPKYKALVLFLILGFSFTHKLIAQTSSPNNIERYAYQYIIELYDRGESGRLINEINSFQARYPQSIYRNHLRFISANLQYEEEDFIAALRIYDDLLKEDIDLHLRHNVYLYRALNLIGMQSFTDAMNQLQVLESETKDSFLLAQANLYKGKLYKELGQYYSAMQAYQNALKLNPDPDIEYEYFEVLVKLGKETEAEQLLEGVNPQSHVYSASHTIWAKYLLDNNRFMDFDEHLAGIPELWNEPNIELLRIRKEISVQNFIKAQNILVSSNNEHEDFLYYKAIISIQNKQISEADSILTELVASARAEIKVLSYLERLKLLFKSEPTSATLQLAEFINNKSNSLLKAEQLFTMGFFAYQKKDYSEALKYFASARAETDNRLIMADIDLMVAMSWLKARDSSMSLNAFNRYLNLYPTGKDRDTALYYLGYLYHEKKDYPLASAAFRQLIDIYPASTHVPSAEFYLAEIDYFMANYHQALDAFLEIVKAEPENSEAILRIAQTYYYLGRYNDVEPWLARLAPSYDSLILEGHIHFIRKEYDAALQSFQKAENGTDDSLKISEAKSYRALCLYQQKRFSEATTLYMELYEGEESADTYLYLGAKSAYSAGDYHLALDLFDQFLKTYPNSQYFLPVLADVANSYFNMGNFNQAIQDYLNILNRFRNTKSFGPTDQALLREVFTGLDLSLGRVERIGIIDEVSAMIDTFESQFIRFELSYLLTKQYVELDEWDSVLEQAEGLRQDFPEYKRNDVELLMAESLIHLNEYNRADSLLSTLYSDTLDLQALVAWADVDVLLQNYDDAIMKFRDAFKAQPSPELWYKALNASVAANYMEFEEIWAEGESFVLQIPAARLILLDYLVYTQAYNDANELADSIINESLNSHDHALAFLQKAIILHNEDQYLDAIDELQKILLLFSDFKDIQNLAAYYEVLSYLKSGAQEEAKLLLWDYTPMLSEKHLSELDELLQEVVE
ncbi:MAG: tetratricopeptide repeat protein [Candidatus Cloacimonetes bacterium]|nr:tetratricopeptide repeat protein [Candidatus Cloacimonadota bacterium]